MSGIDDKPGVGSIYRLLRYDMPLCAHEPCDNPEPGENVTHGNYFSFKANDKFSVGSWRSTAGTLNIRNLHLHEACFVMEGIVEITDEHGEKKVFGPGDAFVLPAQFCGTWHMLAPIMKFSTHLECDKKSQTEVPRIQRFQLPSRPLDPWVQEVRGNLESSGQVDFVDDTGQLTVGGWRCTAGTFRIEDIPVQECNVVIEGVVELSDNYGVKDVFRSGESYFLPKGFSGTVHMPDPVMTYLTRMK